MPIKLKILEALSVAFGSSIVIRLLHWALSSTILISLEQIIFGRTKSIFTMVKLTVKLSPCSPCRLSSLYGITVKV